MGCVPSLSTWGFIQTPNVIMNRIFCYYLTSKYSMTNTYYGRIHSFKYDIAHNKTLKNLLDTIENSLNSLYGEYFEDVKVQCTGHPKDLPITHENTNVLQPVDGCYIVSVKIQCAVDEVEYQLEKNIDIEGNNINNMDELLELLYSIY